MEIIGHFNGKTGTDQKQSTPLTISVLTLHPTRPNAILPQSVTRSLHFILPRKSYLIFYASSAFHYSLFNHKSPPHFNRDLTRTEATEYSRLIFTNKIYIK